jgi:aminopeptidase-like protein
VCGIASPGPVQADTVDPRELGEEMYEFVSELFPICRSITGDGLRETLRRVGDHVPLEIREVPSGTQVFDWTVPREWNIREAYVKDAGGRRVIDFKANNLHVVNYSVPTRGRMSLDELKDHLTTIPERPGWVPYRTSYYRESWGFCLSHDTLLGLEDGEYEVCIDSTLENGSLSYGEYHVPGSTEDEVLISTHVCHPSLANDNLSGVAVATFLARVLTSKPRRLSYRFLFVPGTIGAITWLHANERRVSRIKHGLVLTCVGDAGPVTYKRSRRGDADVDRAVAHALLHSGDDHELLDFAPDGYDERQYCSPAFDLPVGCFMRTPHGRFAEYHTSADNLDFVAAPNLADSLAKVVDALSILEGNATYVNVNPACEPQLGRRGLFRSAGGRKDESVGELALLWVLNLSDGEHSLLDIAERAKLEFRAIRAAADLLVEHKLLKEAA